MNAPPIKTTRSPSCSSNGAAVREVAEARNSANPLPMIIPRRSIRSLRRLDTSEASVILGAIGCALAPRAGDITSAVEIAAQERPTALDSFWSLRLERVVARLRPLGIPFGAVAIVLRPIPVGAPLPDVPHHVDEPEAVGRERTYGCGRGEAILGGVLSWEAALPVVDQPFVSRFQVVAPHVLLAFEAAPRGVFPFGLGR